MSTITDTRSFRGLRQPSGAQVYLAGRPLPLPPLNPRTEVRHSPTGFEWGYTGSGPAELARALLIAVAPADPVVRTGACYQRFKEEIVARLPRDRPWELPVERVLGWLERFHAEAQLPFFVCDLGPFAWLGARPDGRACVVRHGAQDGPDLEDTGAPGLGYYTAVDLWLRRSDNDCLRARGDCRWQAAVQAESRWRGARHGA